MGKPPNPKVGYRPVRALLVLGGMVVLSAYALSRFAGVIDWRLLAGAPVVMSAFAFLAYRSDKLRAAAGEWRIPEATLQLTALFGGWPGAFVAQRVYRHKTAKTSFQSVFWAIVAVHQYVALDSLLAGRLTRETGRLVRSVLG